MYSANTGLAIAPKGRNRSPADCPSGQWERTVNPSVKTYVGSNPTSATPEKCPATWFYGTDRGAFFVDRFAPEGSHMLVWQLEPSVCNLL